MDQNLPQAPGYYWARSEQRFKWYDMIIQWNIYPFNDYWTREAAILSYVRNPLFHTTL